VPQPDQPGPAERVDQLQRAGSAVERNAFLTAETNRLPEHANARDRGLPPKLRLLIDGVAILARCGQRGRGKPLDVALRVDSECANAAGPHINAEEQTCHWNSSPWHSPL